MRKLKASHSAKILFSIVLGYFIINSALGGTEPVNPFYPVELEEVTVFTDDISSVSGAFNRIDSSAIADAAASSIDEILAEIPGSEIETGSRGESQYRIRGGIGRDTGFYINGRSTASPWNGYIDFAGIPMTDVKRITVFKGPAPLKYGSHLAGAVNIETVEPGDKNLSELEIEGGCGGFYRTSISQRGVSFFIPYKIALSLEGRQGYPVSSDLPEELYERGGLRDNSDSKRYAGYVQLFLPVFSKKIEFSTGYSSEERGIPPNTTQFPRWWRFKNWTRYFADLNFASETRGIKYKTTIYYDYYRNRLKRYSDWTYDEKNYMYDSVHNSRVLGWNIGFDSNLSRYQTLSFGNRIHYDLFSISEQDTTSGGFGEPDYYRAFQNETYIETERKFWGLNSLSAGIAALNRNENIFGGDIFLLPRLGLSVHPLKKAQIAFNAGRSVQFPTFQHLYDSDSGNPGLFPEKAWRFEIGGRYYLSDAISFSAWKYLTLIEGRIDRKDRYSDFENLADSELWGEEISLLFRNSAGSMELSAAHMKVKIDEVPEAEFQPLGSDTPPWKIEYKLSWRVWRNMRFAGNVSYLAETKDYNGSSVPDYTLVDLTLSLNPVDWCNVKFNVDNLLDRNYYHEFGFPQPGRTWKLILNFNYKNGVKGK
ncbi:MAG: TonB-dependent receptor [FCB group bacterium]|nr:TonB-dependent receptor [FCB group bacterium]